MKTERIYAAMSNFSFVLLTPTAVKRGLSGIILSRLMVRGKVELAAAELLVLTAGDCAKLAPAIPAAKALNVSEKSASLLLIFQGDSPAGKVAPVLKNIAETFGEGLFIAPADDEQNALMLPFWADVARRDNLLTPAPAEGEERTLLIIKPENFRGPSTRPGAIIDMLMSLDLKWVGCKVHGMSIDEALEFYGPVRDALRNKLTGKIGTKALNLIEKELNFKLPAEQAAQIVSGAGTGFADDQFEQIVEFMAGKKPSQVSEDYYSQPAGAKCMVLIFDGVNAVSKIRTLLGPTNPANAPAGTIRYDFGTDLMVNAAHASDTPESYLRESAIVKVNQNNLSKIAQG